MFFKRPFLLTFSLLPRRHGNKKVMENVDQNVTSSTQNQLPDSPWFSAGFSG